MSIIGDGIMLGGALSGERTLSGPMVSFNGDGSLLSALSVDITAQQSLNGYDGPWPAGGGKNKAKLMYLSSSGSAAYTDLADNSVTVSSTNTSPGYRSVRFALLSAPYFAGQTLTFSAKATVVAGTSTPRIRGRLFESDGTTAVGSQLFESAGTTLSKSFTLPSTISDGVILCVDLYADVNNGGAHEINYYDVQIEAGSSATAFAPYSNICPITGFASAKIHVSSIQIGGTVYEVLFGTAGTVYGGTLNVLTGELTVAKVSQTFLWSAGVSEYAPSGNAFKRRTFALSPTGVAGATHSQMNCIATYNTGTPTTNPYYYIRANGAYFYAWMPLDTDGSAELQVVYDLATPQTYQLTAQQVATLIGRNYVWTECGDVTLTYTWRR